MARPLTDKELLDVAEVAAYLHLRPVTIYRWCRVGRLPWMKRGTTWRIRRTALDEFLRQRERPQMGHRHTQSMETG